MGWGDVYISKGVVRLISDSRVALGYAESQNTL